MNLTVHSAYPRCRRSPPGAILGAMGNTGRRWAWVAVLLVGVGLHLLVLETLAGTGTVTFVPTLIVLGASVAPATFLAFAQGRPGHPRVPGPVGGVAAFLG